MLGYYKLNPKESIKPNTLVIVPHFEKNKRIFYSLLENIFMKGSFLMFTNTTENKKIWVEKVRTILEMGGRSQNTFVNYKSHIKRFLDYYPEDTNFESILEDEILVFLKKNYLDLKKCSSTINVAINAIKFLYSVCFKIELSKKLLPKIKITQALPSIISKQDFISIFNDEKNLKHKCWLLLAFCSGLRASEVVSIRIENIFANEHKIKILGKGCKERYTILPDITIYYLRLYCKYNHITKKTGYLFEGKKGHEHLSDRNPTNYFCRLKEKYNLPKEMCFHSLRHSFATYYLMNGGDLLVLQEMLGHNHLNTTKRYIHFSKDFNHLEGINYVQI